MGYGRIPTVRHAPLPGGYHLDLSCTTTFLPISLMPRRHLAGLVLLSTTFACGGDPVSPPEASYTIAIHGGSAQQGPAGSILEQPLQVTVSNVAGQPVQGVVVRFRAVQGGGSPSDTIGVTGLGGIALTFARLGATVGPQLFEAYMQRAPKTRVTFDVAATPGATLIRVEPTSVAAGDTVDVVGSNFNIDPSGNRVFFGAVTARVLSVTGTSQLRVVVPACAGPGPVATHVEVGSAATNTLSVPYTSGNPLVVLAIGEGITVSGAELSHCLQLQGAGPRYLIVPQFAAAADDPVTTAFRIGYEGALAGAQVQQPATGARLPATISPQRRLDDEMRRIEQEIAPLAAAQESETQGPLEALTLNSSRSFKVITALPKDEVPLKFGTSVARLKYIGSHILVYVDEAAPSAISDADLTRIGALFDTRLYDLDVARFGSESDLDRNGKVIVLMSQSVNKLVTRAECSTGFVAGYFYPNDLYLRNQNSNKGEVFYTIVPDPAGSVSCVHSISAVRKLVPSTFVHEFQHMISFNQHVLARGGSSEDVWLNEGLSLIAEETTGRFYEEAYPPLAGQAFSDSAAMFSEDVMINAFNYLFASKSYSVTTFKDFGDLEERGAAWLFLRWLGDQKGDDIYARLVQTRLTSIANIQDKTRESFPALFGDFAIASAADIPAFARASMAPRYRFAMRPNGLDYKAVFARLGKAVPNPVQFTPLQTYAAASTYSMVQGTMAFFNLQTASLPQPALGLVFTAGSGQAFPPLLVAQVGIVRVE
jgi:hypothetical protein